jgi:two-component sensor histidine kinase
MSDTRQRISALALIYRALYQSADLRSVDVRQFLEELIGQLSASDGARPMLVRTELYADDLEIDPDKLAPLALFAVEGIALARKRVFPQDQGVIRVRFAVDPGTAWLEIADNSVGRSQPGTDDGVSETLMNAFARQLRGGMERSATEDGERTVRLVFPRPDAAQEASPAPFQLSAAPPRTRAANPEPQESA